MKFVLLLLFMAFFTSWADAQVDEEQEESETEQSNSSSEPSAPTEEEIQQKLSEVVSPIKLIGLDRPLILEENDLYFLKSVLETEANKLVGDLLNKPRSVQEQEFVTLDKVTTPLTKRIDQSELEIESDKIDKLLKDQKYLSFEKITITTPMVTLIPISKHNDLSENRSSPISTLTTDVINVLPHLYRNELEREEVPVMNINSHSANLSHMKVSPQSEFADQFDILVGLQKRLVSYKCKTDDPSTTITPQEYNQLPESLRAIIMPKSMANSLDYFKIEESNRTVYLAKEQGLNDEVWSVLIEDENGEKQHYIYRVNRDSRDFFYNNTASKKLPIEVHQALIKKMNPNFQIVNQLPADGPVFKLPSLSGKEIQAGGILVGAESNFRLNAEFDDSPYANMSYTTENGSNIHSYAKYGSKFETGTLIEVGTVQGAFYQRGDDNILIVSSPIMNEKIFVSYYDDLSQSGNDQLQAQAKLNSNNVAGVNLGTEDAKITKTEVFVKGQTPLKLSSNTNSVIDYFGSAGSQSGDLVYDVRGNFRTRIGDNHAVQFGGQSYNSYSSWNGAHDIQQRQNSANAFYTVHMRKSSLGLGARVAAGAVDGQTYEQQQVVFRMNNSTDKNKSTVYISYDFNNKNSIQVGAASKFTNREGQTTATLNLSVNPAALQDQKRKQEILNSKATPVFLTGLLPIQATIILPIRYRQRGSAATN